MTRTVTLENGQKARFTQRGNCQLSGYVRINGKIVSGVAYSDGLFYANLNGVNAALATPANVMAAANL